ncbi:diguanylate cyclase [Vibrio sinaloensis]|uniref:diguanylate cyclase n=1 Tax=Photobacterium sp. (strain ATCC 43367) TaxID=379097 RepID=UPI002045DE8A|nr:diguanylate cyclase [Vibrio sinaloensis]UPQ89174.1 diguanylate cyclase [Vibrio sinaloensis]
MIKKLSFLFILVISVSLNPLAHADTVTVRKVEGLKEEIVFDILKLALSKTRPNVQFSTATEEYNEARLMEEVISGNIDVMWAGAAPDKEEKMLTVRIPILKGLLGHRIFIIRKEDQARFASIQTLNQLKAFDAGQGTFWGDTKVLKAAQIPTITTIKYANLFPMLEGGRFDYFPRAVHEPWSEVDSRPELNLTIDKNVMLVYPFAMYFFVSPNNQTLHDDIYNGFEMAIQDGSFDDLFFNHPMIKEVLAKANLKERMVFRIPNPYMHEETPFDRKEFWLDVSKL